MVVLQRVQPLLLIAGTWWSLNLWFATQLPVPRRSLVRTSPATILLNKTAHHQKPLVRVSSPVFSLEEFSSPEDSPPFPYWNLSCPLEMSSFSATHMGKDYQARAWEARTLALPAVLQIQQLTRLNSRIFFVGDSLLRQVFISMACLNPIQYYAVPWYEKRPVRTRLPNTIRRGPHSKFDEARVWSHNNIELIYHHGMGGLLELEQYESHDPGLWIQQCLLGQPFTTTALTKQVQSETNIQRETIRLRPTDIVLLNGSVHGERDFNLQNIVDLQQCMQQSKVKHLWPRFVYMVTPPEHFPTPSGKFEPALLNLTKDYKCRQEAVSNDRFQDEASRLHEYMPLVGKPVLDLQLSRGDLHVGGRDCLHWLMPGMPDLMAASLVDFMVNNMTTSTAVTTRHQ
jgi:hypothetical protein